MLGFINAFYVPSGKKKRLIVYAEMKRLPPHHWDLQLFHRTLSDFQ